MSTEEKIAEIRAEYLAAEAERFDNILDRCTESPIERLLLAEMLLNRWGDESTYESPRDTSARVAKMAGGPVRAYFVTDECACACVTQLPVRAGGMNFRIDFAFMGMGDTGPVRVAVELDGHDFHERTRLQASRDKKRDRLLSAQGWTVLRFTGGDVYRDAYAVLEEIEQLCNRLAWPSDYPPESE